MNTTLPAVGFSMAAAIALGLLGGPAPGRASEPWDHEALRSAGFSPQEPPEADAASCGLKSALLGSGLFLADLLSGPEPTLPGQGTRPTGFATGVPLRPAVESEQEVYAYRPADNGAGPLWCGGSTCLVRAGDRLFASGLETILQAKPLNNCRWLLFERAGDTWQQVLADPEGLTREPSPLAGFADGRLFLSANPTLVPGEYSGRARPEVLEFPTAGGRPIAMPPAALKPVWQGTPEFTEHSYRSFAADGEQGELLLAQNIGYTHAEWSFRDRAGVWSANGRLPWPEAPAGGAAAAKPGPVRVCYPNVALHRRAVHFCGVSDIIEPNPEWRAFKKQLTGRDWDYDFRRLFYTWTPDIAAVPFKPWLEVASREATAGWITPGDLWIGPDSRVHLVWTERALDERLREKFFPNAKQSHALNYAVLAEGSVQQRQTLALAEEGGSREVPSAPRFQITPDGRLFVVYYVSGSDASGKGLSENRVLEIGPDGKPGMPMTLPLQRPLSQFFTATVRAGSPRSDVLEMLGQPASGGHVIQYARVRLLSR